MTPITELTLEDFFTAMALQGDIASQDIYNDIRQEWLDDRAKLYYRIADAMLKARKEHD